MSADTTSTTQPYADRFDDSFMRQGPFENAIAVVVILALLFALLVGVRRKQ